MLRYPAISMSSRKVGSLHSLTLVLLHLTPRPFGFLFHPTSFPRNFDLSIAWTSSLPQLLTHIAFLSLLPYLPSRSIQQPSYYFYCILVSCVHSPYILDAQAVRTVFISRQTAYLDSRPIFSADTFTRPLVSSLYPSLSKFLLRSILSFLIPYKNLHLLSLRRWLV